MDVMLFGVSRGALMTDVELGNTIDDACDADLDTPAARDWWLWLVRPG